jgi:murein tripeptide amidase MpaA
MNRSQKSKLIGSIHGDETVGYEMLIRTIELLCESYGTDPRITNIVDNTELWINHLYNPDGYVLGQRFNANGVDLNRNFPMPNGITNPDGYPTATENLAMMDFSNQHNFVSGINFHGVAW